MAPVGEVKLAADIEQVADGSWEGAMRISFRPSTDSNSKELFGFIKAAIILEGRMRLHAGEQRTSHAYIFFNEVRPLFRKVFTIFEGPIRLLAGEVRDVQFKARFPSCIDDSIDFLPPPLDIRMEVKAPGQYGKHQGSAHVVYTMGMRAAMPSIDVDYNVPPPMALQYKPPTRSLGSESTLQFSQTLSVASYDLLPEDERVSGLFGKAKAVLRNVEKPVYGFSVHVNGIATSLPIGSRMTVEVRVQHEDSSTTSTIRPDIVIGDCTMVLVGRTHWDVTDSERGTSQTFISSAVVEKLKMIDQDNSAPFSKESDWTKRLTFATLPDTIPNTFNTKHLGRAYRMRLDLEFLVAGQVVIMSTKDKDVTILPPTTKKSEQSLTEVDGLVESGPSRADQRNTLLPAYEAASGSADVSGSSGSQQRNTLLPTYEEAMG